MFTRKTSLVWIGILTISCMFLMGQESWHPADPCAGIDCGEHRICLDNGGVAECDCEENYYGDLCDYSIIGSWEVNFDWDCTGFSLTGTWELYADGTFYDSFDDSGTWTLEGALFDIYYALPSVAHYTGTVVGNTMSGTMSSDTDSGCWDGRR